MIAGLDTGKNLEFLFRFQICLNFEFCSDLEKNCLDLKKEKEGKTLMGQPV
jgi:hypothetical protein